MSESQGKIISLTYHEITADPRVLKQARVLQKAGYKVHVFCDWSKGMPQHDDIDGVEITRFRCYHPSGVTREAFEEMTFLKRSRDEIARRYLPYAAACERLENARPFLEKRFGPNVIDRAQSLYFKRSSGSERRRRMFEYFYLNLRLRYLRVPAGNAASEAGTQARGVDLVSYRNLRRQLFQAESIAFASNFPALDTAEKVKAVHAHDLYCLPAGVMLSRKLGVPLVYDAHEYEPARASKMDKGALRLPEFLEDDCFAHVSRIITVSDGIGELYAERFPGPAPTIIMNAPEVDAGASGGTGSEVRTIREMAGLAEDVPLIVFTGLILGEQRGIDKLLEAMTLLPSAHFVSLGSRVPKADKWLLTLAEQFGVRERVTLLPPVDAREVPAVLRSATVSIAPIQDASLSYRYCMPNKLFEAAFARIPICVSDLPEMKRFVERLGIGRVMDQTDPKSIAAALQNVFDNRSDYLMGPRAEKVLLETYSWQAQSEKLLALYSDLVGAPATDGSAAR
ncbi:MAG: glycosyltransferase [Pseudomonadota bacterium]